GVLHVLHGGSAARARFFAPEGEFEIAMAANDLVLLFGRDHAAAVAALDEAGERELTARLRPGIAFFTEKRLHPVILRGSDHWLVLSLIEVTAALGIFKLAIIKGLGEHAVDHGPGNRLAAGFAALTRLELPILVGDAENFSRSIQPGQHEFPHLSNERETLRVLDEDAFAGGPHPAI